MKVHVKSICRSLISVIVILLLTISPALAVFDWVGGTGTDFDTAANWSPAAAPTVADNAGSLAFDLTGGANRTITGADAGAYAGFTGMSFTGASGAYSITGTGSLAFVQGSTITGDGANTHTLAINLVSAGTGLTFDGAASYTVSGVVSGTIITKSGAGTLSLGGNNTYSGATTISAGTLAVTANNALGTNVGATTVASGATLDIQNTAYSTTEGLTVNGGTISTSTGTSTFAGAVTLGAGSTIGVAGTQLTLSGIIGDGGGAFGLTKTGAGIAVLSGTNTYTGTTTINAGTLKVSGGTAIANAGAVSLANVAGAIFDLTTSETIGSLAGGGTTGGNVNLNANTLTVGDATNTTYSGVISGTGALTKAGAGKLTLSGINLYTGLTNITAGTLGGAFTTAGNLTVSTGGTLAPGNSIGTVVIGGNYSLAAGGTLEVEVSKAASGALSSDFLDVGGTATLAAGSTIHVLDITPAGRLIGTGDTFNIIEADGGVTNNGPTITDNSAVLSFAGGVSGNFYQLTATRQSFASALGVGGGSPLAAIDSDLGNATGDYITVINALTALNTAAEIGSAEEQLDPLPHASATTVSLRTTQQMAGNLANYLSARRSGTERAMMFDTQTREHQLLIADASSDPRLLAYVIDENKRIEKMQQEEADSQIKGFFRPFGVFYNHDSTSKMTGFNAKAVGTQFGFDKSFGSNLILGIGGGYSHSFINFKGNRGESDVDSFRAGPYASYFKDNFFVDTSVSFGYHKNKNERDIRFINRTADSDYDAYDLSAYIGTGYDFHLKNLTATPTVSFQYISYRNESFKETGAGAAGLNVDAATSNSLRSKLGMAISKVTEFHGTKIVPEIFAGWAHEFMNDEDIRARFVQGAAKFTTDVDDEWDDSIYFGAGLSALLKKNISAFVRYEGEYSSGNGINALNFGVTILF